MISTLGQRVLEYDVQLFVKFMTWEKELINMQLILK